MFLDHPRTHHYITPQSCRLSELLGERFLLSQERTHELLALGSIYLNRRRVFEDGWVNEGVYLRLHLHPKRFPVSSVSWDTLVLKETEHYVLIRKPAGIPVHATLDNSQENVLYQLNKIRPGPLLVTQRLDVPVTGILVFAKTKTFQSRFNTWLADRKISKRYRALVSGSPTKGKKVHYMEPGRRPRRVEEEEHPGWPRCELTIERVGTSMSPLSEVSIELHTGRTHQIRAQLSALGCPISGDRLYGSKHPVPWASNDREEIALASTELAWDLPGFPSEHQVLAPPWCS